jgi:hypothetical protein
MFLKLWFVHYVGWIILILAQKLVWHGKIFDIPHYTNQAATRHGALGFPSQPSKIMHWMYQVTWHVFEAVIWSLCWLDILVLAQKLCLGN